MMRKLPGRGDGHDWIGHRLPRTSRIRLELIALVSTALLQLFTMSNSLNAPQTPLRPRAASKASRGLLITGRRSCALDCSHRETVSIWVIIANPQGVEASGRGVLCEVNCSTHHRNLQLTLLHHGQVRNLMSHETVLHVTAKASMLAALLTCAHVHELPANHVLWQAHETCDVNRPIQSYQNRLCTMQAEAEEFQHLM